MGSIEHVFMPADQCAKVDGRDKFVDGKVGKFCKRWKVFNSHDANRVAMDARSARFVEGPESGSKRNGLT